MRLVSIVRVLCWPKRCGVYRVELNWHCSEATTESQCSAPETNPKSRTTARLHKQVLSAGLRWLSDAEAVEAVKQNAKERGNDTDFDKLVNLASFVSFLFLLPFIAHLQLSTGSFQTYWCSSESSASCFPGPPRPPSLPSSGTIPTLVW